MEVLDSEDGDLALPPPALELDERAPYEEEQSTSFRQLSDLPSEVIEGKRSHPDWHISDVPLSPHTKFTLDFAKGFSTAPRRDSAVDGEESLAARANLLASRAPQQHTSSPLDERSNQEQPGGTPHDPSGSPSGEETGGAWWLDVSFPTYRDMVEISKVS